MNYIKKILFTIAFYACLSCFALSQTNTEDRLSIDNCEMGLFKFRVAATAFRKEAREGSFLIAIDSRAKGENENFALKRGKQILELLNEAKIEPRSVVTATKASEHDVSSIRLYVNGAFLEEIRVTKESLICVDVEEPGQKE